MHKTTLQFAVDKSKSSVAVGKSAILQPKPNFKGGSIRWYEDKPKKK